MHLRVGSCKQRTRRVVHIHLDQQRTGGHIDGVGSAHELSLKFAIRELSEADVRCHAVFDPLRVFLWDVYIDTQYPGLSDVEEIGLGPPRRSRN